MHFQDELTIDMTHFSGEGCRITVAPKGFGSENMSRIQMLKPADGVEGFKKFVVDTAPHFGIWKAAVRHPLSVQTACWMRRRCLQGSGQPCRISPAQRRQWQLPVPPSWQAPS